MVESKPVKNYNISFFLTLMHSPLVSKRNIINGHAIYNALLRTGKFNPNDILKVSFGISQNIPITLEGSNKYHINIEEEAKIEKIKGKVKKEQKTILDNIEKHKYEGFTVLRKTKNELTNPLIDYSPIRFENIEHIHGNETIHCIPYFIFFIVWKNDANNIDFKNLEFNIGRSRNNGFGFCRVEKFTHKTTDFILSDIDFDKYTALNGILGIYNHSKYGFGEYILEETKEKMKLFKLTTPLCMKSQIPETTIYGSLPSFIKPIEYRKNTYYLWNKGKEYKLEVINSGKVFELE